MTTYKILGITDEVGTCDKCGKMNLKRTVAISIDGADPVYYGTTCAARAIAGKGSGKVAQEINELARAIEYAQKWVKHYAGRDVAQSIASAIRTKFQVAARVTGYRVIALTVNDGRAWVNCQGELIDDPAKLFG